jgi:hypothetical protein
MGNVSLNFCSRAEKIADRLQQSNGKWYLGKSIDEFRLKGLVNTMVTKLNAENINGKDCVQILKSLAIVEAISLLPDDVKQTEEKASTLFRRVFPKVIGRAQVRSAIDTGIDKLKEKAEIISVHTAFLESRGISINQKKDPIFLSENSDIQELKECEKNCQVFIMKTEGSDFNNKYGKWLKSLNSTSVETDDKEEKTEANSQFKGFLKALRVSPSISKEEASNGRSPVDSGDSTPALSDEIVSEKMPIKLDKKTETIVSLIKRKTGDYLIQSDEQKDLLNCLVKKNIGNPGKAFSFQSFDHIGFIEILEAFGKDKWENIKAKQEIWENILKKIAELPDNQVLTEQDIQKAALKALFEVFFQKYPNNKVEIDFSKSLKECVRQFKEKFKDFTTCPGNIFSFFLVYNEKTDLLARVSFEQIVLYLLK